MIELEDGKFRLYHADCMDALQEIDEKSVASVVCDPPYEIGFQAKSWDRSGIAFDVEMWKMVYRVIKPGGYLAAFGFPRMYHRVAVAIEDAGFEIRDSLHWIYGLSFPKSENVSKELIDKYKKIEEDEKKSSKQRESIVELLELIGVNEQGKSIGDKSINTERQIERYEHLSEKFDGWGTALKNCHEPIILARRPMIDTLAGNYYEYETGGLNIGECKIGENVVTINTWDDGARPFGGEAGGSYSSRDVKGKWPSNLMFSHHEKCKEIKPGVFNCYRDCRVLSLYFEHKDAIEYYNCFKYEPKAGRSEKEIGCEGLETKSAADMTGRKEGSAGLKHPRAGASPKDGAKNSHATVKPIAIMAWLIRLLTPKDGITMDHFMGSGTSGMAAHQEGCKYIGIEKEEESFEIAKSRIDHATKQRRIF